MATSNGHETGHYQLSAESRRQVMIAFESAVTEAVEDAVSEMMDKHFDEIFHDALTRCIERYIKQRLIIFTTSEVAPESDEVKAHRERLTKVTPAP